MPVGLAAAWRRLATLSREPSKRLKTGTPLRCEYWPVNSVARQGVQIELVTKEFVKRAPAAARRSRCGVWLTCEP
jgi:hypothetical protein